MIVDTSAIIAIVRIEPERPLLFQALAKARSIRISAGSWVELGVVLARRRDAAMDAELERLLRTYRLQIAPVTEMQAKLAWAAYRTFGVGSGHAARLNFGDCFAYALAKERGEPLLFKGGDFAATDIVAAI